MGDLKIAVCSTVHQYDDPRVFHRETMTLAKNFQVKLFICSPFRYKKISKNLEIIGLPVWRFKIDRVKNILILILLIRKFLFDIIVIHDPELLLIVPFLKVKFKAKIIYDIHENYKFLISDKTWLPKYTRNLISLIYEYTEKIMFRYLDMIWYPVKDIGSNYNNIKYVQKKLIQNLPSLDFFSYSNVINNKRENQLIYVGGIEADRGTLQIIKGFSILKQIFPDYKLVFVGPIYQEAFKEQIYELIKSLKLSKNVFLHGKIPYERVSEFLCKSKAGLLLPLPTKNWLHSMPIKLFEYMAIGLPVIASNFQNFKEIVEKNNCGICIDPNDVVQIGDAMRQLVTNEEERIKMGINGNIAIKQIYNWDNESLKMINSIKSILS